LDVIYGSKFDQKLYVLRGDTGAKIWSYTLSHQIDASPAVADVDGDGVMDIVLGDKNGKVYALSGPEAKNKAKDFLLNPQMQTGSEA